jgi:chemotaxis protein methyltransferase CheR
MSQAKPLSRETQADISRWITRECGVVLGPDKAYLLEHRLSGLLKDFSLPSYEALRDRLQDGRLAGVAERVVEAIVTHETSFFRDRHPFEALRAVMLPAARQRWLADRAASLLPPRPIRIWSAACSTGQEPVSLAISALEWLRSGAAADLRPTDFVIVATDISARILKMAREGRFTTAELDRGMAAELRARYFTAEGSAWVVSPEVARLIEYRRLNFADPVPVAAGMFDIIFCRNVLIYFDEALKRRVVDEFSRSLPAGGILVLGSAESLYGISDRFQSVTLGGSPVYLRN